MQVRSRQAAETVAQVRSRHEMKAAYYARLNADEQVVAQLELLYQSIDAGQPADWRGRPGDRRERPLDWDELLGGASVAAQSIIGKGWLPGGGRRDLEHSYRACWLRRGERQIEAARPIGTGVVLGIVRLPDDTIADRLTRDALERVTCELLDGFPFSDQLETPKEVGARLRRVFEGAVQGAVTQAEQLWSEAPAAGHRRVSPKRRNAQILDRMARRLYRRAVLLESPEKIAEHERSEDQSEFPDTETVRATIDDWAAQLRLSLPPLRKGRPRRGPKLT
jgi:hypothetical protein